MKGIQAIVEVSISGNYLGEPLPHSESAAALVAPEVSSLALGVYLGVMFMELVILELPC